MTKLEEKKKEIARRQQLFRPYWNIVFDPPDRRLFYAAMLFTKNNSWDAEDMVQGIVCRMLHYCPDPAGVKDVLSYVIGSMRLGMLSEIGRKAGIREMSIDHEEDGESSTAELPDLTPDVLSTLQSRELIDIIKADPGPMTDLEGKIFRLFLLDLKCSEIAKALNLDQRIVRYELNNLRTKIIQRFQKRFMVKKQGE